MEAVRAENKQLREIVLQLTRLVLAGITERRK
jgi:hypothetical protein